uniref:Putative secreted protein n=1 Tax=Anopheles triannulatus TaxID=58253 RepID=A0A2M4B4K8_9DIPT
MWPSPPGATPPPSAMMSRFSRATLAELLSLAVFSACDDPPDPRDPFSVCTERGRGLEPDRGSELLEAVSFGWW